MVAQLCPTPHTPAQRTLTEEAHQMVWLTLVAAQAGITETVPCRRHYRDGGHATHFCYIEMCSSTHWLPLWSWVEEGRGKPWAEAWILFWHWIGKPAMKITCFLVDQWISPFVQLVSIVFSSYTSFRRVFDIRRLAVLSVPLVTVASLWYK
jgi:hypothetical protein